MRIHLVADNGTYNGTVRSVSHNTYRGSTKIVFVGGISKFFKDKDERILNQIHKNYTERKTYATIIVDEFECILEEPRLL